MQGRTRKRKESLNPMAPAVKEWQQQEAVLKAEASAWVRAKLQAHFFVTERGYEPVTTADMLHMLDADLSMPSGWARILKSDKVHYQERYSVVRNALEGMARQRILVMGTTINAKGLERATTYARPRDATPEWSLELEGDDAALDRARASVRKWLEHDGGSLEGISGIMLTRKNNKVRGDKSNGSTKAKGTGNGNPGTKSAARGRKPRTTRGGD